MAGSCEHGTEPSSSIKGGKFIDLLSDFASQGLCSMYLHSFELQLVVHEPEKQ
jgi:hypothetical protein